MTTNEIERATRCPDCNSDAEADELMPGVLMVTISHDDTCPWFRKHGQEGVA
jgi:hypothetical protein